MADASTWRRHLPENLGGPDVRASDMATGL